MNPNIIGYHSNYKTKIDSFLTKNDLIIHEDKEYLGRGMYFWDNVSNAEYWANKKIKESEGKVKNIDICCANIILNEPVLDLTDQNIIILVRDLWIEYCEKQEEKKIKQYLGTILDILYSFFPVIEEMKVSKCYGDYSHYKKLAFLASLGKKSYIDNRPRTIYSVRCKSRVVNPRFFETVSV